MKNLHKIVLICILLISITAFSQKEYNPWSVDFGVGAYAANDPSYTTFNSMHLNSNWEMGAKYNFNPTLAVGLRYGISNMEGQSAVFMLPGDNNHIPSMMIDSKYQRLSIEATIDILDVVDIHNNTFTLLIHGGIGGATVKTDYGHFEKMGMFSGGLTGVFRLSNRIGLKLDYTITSHIDQHKTLDGIFSAGAEGMTSNVHSGTVGIIVWLGKKDKRPADFYYKPDCTVIHQSDTTIVNNYNTAIVEKITVKEDYIPIVQEFVFFDHDEDIVRGSEDNAIYQIYTHMNANKESEVNIIGWASATSSSAKYNLELSTRRCEKLKQKLLDADISADRISIDPSGKDYHLEKENVHDLGRRVELIIVK
jgi:OOP family OmpA-OmpF porin